ncbi:hypothetical protein CC78DRAFT_533578 [Lojkania enalia]|uniref:26S proteasome complex subunit SEM1 n=1 Tax=Lojkania enalia TaxID=147567 RepID=A0A9P4K8Y5_9PLEO|nr:hypothetical protein CC78DRAFT_533578 [Didymosphaeria enalia]
MSKNTVSDKKEGEENKDQQKPAAQLEEDDEFEDFPIEGMVNSHAEIFREGHVLTRALDWPEEDTQLPGGNAHLWEESWDDDDTNDDFAVQLKYVDDPASVG